MWIADMDFVVAPEIVAAITRRAERATFGYSGFSDTYFETLIAWYKNRHQMEFCCKDVLYSNGTISAIRNVIRTFTNEGDGVIIQPPVYYPFHNITAENHRNVVENHLLVDAENHYSIDFEDFEQKCADPRNKLFILCNPHNPIGQIWNREVVQRLIDICNAHEVLIFSDEVHADITRQEATFTSTLNMEHTQGVIVATAANKTFNLAGLHVTNLVIKNHELRNKLDSYMGEIPISPFSEVGAIAAYSECGEWVDEMNSVLDDNLSYMEQFLKERMPKVRFNRPQATYLAWLDFRAYGYQEQEMLTLCTENAHLILENGAMFGTAGSGFIRMSVACPKSILIEALERLEKVFNS